MFLFFMLFIKNFKKEVLKRKVDCPTLKRRQLSIKKLDQWLLAPGVIELVPRHPKSNDQTVQIKIIEWNTIVSLFW